MMTANARAVGCSVSVQGFATDENNIRFILEKLAEAQQQGRITQ